MYQVEVQNLKVGQIVLEEDSYGNCVHKVMCEPYFESEGWFVQTFDLDDLRPCELGGRLCNDIFMLVSDGTPLKKMDIVEKINKW